MKLRFIDSWQTEFHRLWSIRYLLVFGAFIGVAAAPNATSATTATIYGIGAIWRAPRI